MSAKHIQFNQEARNSLLRGINILGNAVKATLGPCGRHVVVSKKDRLPYVTKDGVSVAKETELEDEIEDTGARLARNVASKVNEEVGDGTTTATVLAQALMNEGMRAVAANMSPVAIKRGIERATRDAVSALDSMSLPCNEPESIRRIATISANGDREVGQMIADALSEIGSEGVITVEDGSGLDLELKLVKGMQFDRGYASPHFINDHKTMSVDFENPLILAIDGKFVQELAPQLRLAPPRSPAPPGTARTRHPHRRAHRRHAAGRAPTVHQGPPRHPHHDPRIALPDPDLERARRIARCPHDHHRRDSRAGADQARCASRARRWTASSPFWR